MRKLEADYLLGLSQRLDLLKQKVLIKVAKSDSLTKDFLKENDGIYRKLLRAKRQ